MDVSPKQRPPPSTTDFTLSVQVTGRAAGLSLQSEARNDGAGRGRQVKSQDRLKARAPAPVEL